MYSVERTNQFKKDYKRIKKRHYDLLLLQDVIKQLVTGMELPANYKPHELSGNYKHFQECHIKHDWLLIYQVDHEQEVVKLIRTGTHSDLFE